MQVKEILDQHAQVVCTIDGNQTVEDAIAEMSSQRVSALIVMENGIPVGLFAERDVLRCYMKAKGKTFSEVKVKDAMTNKLIVTEPEEKISVAIATMIKAEIRHLPVVEDKKIIAMLTINALISHQIGTLTEELHYLHEYISDLQDARQD